MFRPILTIAVVGMLLTSAACGGTSSGDKTKTAQAGGPTTAAVQPTSTNDARSRATLAISDRLLTTSDLPTLRIAREYNWTDAAGVRDDGLGTTTVQASPADAFDVVTKAGFKSGAARVFARDAASEPHDRVIVIALELGSESGAKSVQTFSADDDEKPCPETCAFEITKTTAPGIPGARGIRRLATAANIAAVGDTSTAPAEIYRIVFTDGAYFYYVEVVAAPDGGAADRAQALASTLYKRVQGAPAPSP